MKRGVGNQARLILRREFVEERGREKERGRERERGGGGRVREITGDLRVKHGSLVGLDRVMWRTFDFRVYSLASKQYKLHKKAIEN